MTLRTVTVRALKVRVGAHRHRSEQGAIVVVSALMLTTFMAVAALVMDGGLLRINSRKLQSAVDLAIVAGGQDLGGGDPMAACIKTVTYLNTNMADLPAIDASSFCDQSGNDVSQTICKQAGYHPQATPTITAGAYRVTLQYPVTDAQILDSKRTGAGVNDGTPCERMRIQVNGTQSTLFARVMGVNSLSTTRSATVRGFIGTQNVVPALWLLDPYGCTALSVSGGSRLSVGSTENPGIVVLDSDGSSCSSNQVSISSTGTGTLVEAVPQSGASVGRIILRALSSSATLCSPPACDAADVSGGRLNPQPTGNSQRATRSPVDWRYNCKTVYPAYHGIAIAPCPTTTTPYLDNLISAVTAANPDTSGFQRWSTSFSCNPTGMVTAVGNWWVDCPSGLSIGNGTNVVFTGGNIVFNQGLKMTGGNFTVNNANPTASLPSACVTPAVFTSCLPTSSASSAFIYVRNGNWSVTGGVISIKNTFAYQASGYLKVAGGAPPTWTAPTEGPFSGISYWSELSSSQFQINGGAGVTLGGVFFIPEANPFSLSGGGDWGQQHAQFISYRLAVSGNSQAKLVPDPSAVGIPPKRALLIR